MHLVIPVSMTLSSYNIFSVVLGMNNPILIAWDKSWFAKFTGSNLNTQAILTAIMKFQIAAQDCFGSDYGEISLPSFSLNSLVYRCETSIVLETFLPKIKLCWGFSWRIMEGRGNQIARRNGGRHMIKSCLKIVFF